MTNHDATTNAVPMPRPRWIVRTAVPTALIVAAAGLLAWAGLDSIRAAQDVAVMPVVTRSVTTVSSTPQAAAGDVVVQAPGWLEPAPYPIYVTALESGVVDSVNALEGDEVTAGDVLATMIDEDARIALARAEATLAKARAGREQAEADYRAATQVLETLIDRKRTKAIAQAKLAEINASVVRAESMIAVAVAKLAETEDEYQRKAALLESEAVSEATVVRLQLRVKAQQAAVEAARAELDVLQANRATAEAELIAATDHVNLLIEENHTAERAEAQLELAMAAEQLAAADRDDAQLALDRMTIRVPQDGVILRRLVVPGSNIRVANDMHAAHLFHIYNPEQLQVRVDVPLSDAAKIGVGQEAEIEVEVLPNRMFRGRVARIVHEADIQKNTVEVKVDVIDPVADLKPEMLTRVRFLGGRTSADSGTTSSSRMAVFIPEELIDESDAGTRVLVVEARVNGRGVVAERMITLGQERVDGWLEITDGLVPGDLVIQNEGTPVTPGDVVRFQAEVG